MKNVLGAFLGAAALLSSPSNAETTLTVATVNNGDMIRMQGLTSDFTAKNPDIVVKWVTLEENVLRQRVTTDIATKGGQFDVLTIGTYEVPIWAKKNWLVPLDNLGADYDVGDLLPKIRDAVSVDANSYGARWFDEKWQPQFDTPEWKKTLSTYVDLMKEAGPPGASSNGFNENLALFDAGKCAMWIDATVAASFVTNPKDSKVADKVGFAMAPNAGLGKNANWLWAWNLAIPAGSKKVEAAEKFIAWATSKDYTKLVAAKEGWANVPPGTRTSLYANPDYLKVAPFAKPTLASIDAADPNKPTVQPVPYVGVQYAAIPEFQGIGTAVGCARGRAILDRTRNEARRLYQIGAFRRLVSPELTSRPSVALPQRMAALFASFGGVDGNQTDAIARAHAADAGGRAAVRLDDRAAGADHLFLDAALQSA